MDPGDARRQADQAAQALTSALAQSISLRRHRVSTRASIGIAVCPDDTDDFEAVLHAVDSRVYAVLAHAVSLHDRLSVATTVRVPRITVLTARER